MLSAIGRMRIGVKIRMMFMRRFSDHLKVYFLWHHTSVASYDHELDHDGGGEEEKKKEKEEGEEIL